MPDRSEVVYLERKRVWIESTPTDSGPLTVKFDGALAASTNIPIGTLQPGQSDDLALLANFEKISPGLGGVSPAVLGATDVPDTVWTQVLIDAGDLRGGNLGSTVWEIPGTLRDDRTPIVQPLLTEVIWTLSDLQSAVIHLVDLDTGDDETLDVEFATPDSEVLFTIQNVCETNPLEWDLAPEPEDDEDFVWHYELLADANKLAILRRLLSQFSMDEQEDVAALQAITARIHSESDRPTLPYPTVRTQGAASPSGDNCKGGGAASADLDDLWTWLDDQRS